MGSKARHGRAVQSRARRQEQGARRMQQRAALTAVLIDFSKKTKNKKLKIFFLNQNN